MLITCAHTPSVAVFVIKKSVPLHMQVAGSKLFGMKVVKIITRDIFHQDGCKTMDIIIITTS